MVIRVLKGILFLIIMLVSGRTLGDPNTWLNNKFTFWLVELTYGNREPGIEKIEDIIFYISLVIHISISTIIYFIIIKLIRRK